MKRIYMERVEQHESADEVVINRLRLRKYLRELFQNQKYAHESLLLSNMKDQMENIPDNAKEKEEIKNFLNDLTSRKEMFEESTEESDKFKTRTAFAKA